MLISKAEEYLNDVLEHKRCIPYLRFGHSIQFGLTKGRYPEKSVRIVLNLLKNALKLMPSQKNWILKNW